MNRKATPHIRDGERLISVVPLRGKCPAPQGAGGEKLVAIQGSLLKQPPTVTRFSDGPSARGTRRTQTRFQSQVRPGDRVSMSCVCIGPALVKNVKVEREYSSLAGLIWRLLARNQPEAWYSAWEMGDFLSPRGIPPIACQTGLFSAFLRQISDLQHYANFSSRKMCACKCALYPENIHLIYLTLRCIECACISPAVPNRNSPPCILLRESYRVGRKTFQRTLANLTSWPAELLENFKILLKGGHAQPGSLEDSFEICSSRPHGHAYAVRATIDKLGLPALIGRSPGPERDLMLGAIAGRILFESYSKLALARELSTDTASTSLGELCGLDTVRVEDIYTAMRWLLPRQQKIEKALAQRHLTEGSLVLYDLTSTWYEGECCPLAELRSRPRWQTRQTTNQYRLALR